MDSRQPYTGDDGDRPLDAPLITGTMPGSSGTSPPGEQMQQAKDQLKSARETVKEQARHASEQVRHGAQAATEQARRTAADATRMLKEQGQRTLDDQRTRAADSLGSVSSALHDAADRLRQEQDSNIAAYTGALADGVDRMAGYLRERPASELINDCKEFARRQPEWFLGGMFIAGLALARFAKASPRGGRQFSGNYGADEGTDFRSNYGSDFGQQQFGGESGSGVYGSGPAPQGTGAIPVSPSSDVTAPTFSDADAADGGFCPPGEVR